MNSAGGSVKRGRKVLSLHASSTMMWTTDIDVIHMSKRRLKLVLMEQSITYDRPRREVIHWKIQYSPYDLVSQVGMALLEDPRDWSIEGSGSITAEPASSIDEEYLALCWHNSEYRVVGELLTDVGADERAAIHHVFGGFQDPDLLHCCEVIAAWRRRRGGSWVDVAAQAPCSPALTRERSWWLSLASALEKEMKAQDAEKARRHVRTYGEASLFSDLKALVERCGSDIPPGYLLHMTLFSAPPAGPVFDAIVMAWGRRRVPLPAGEGEVVARISCVSIGDPDFAFAAWLFREDKRNKLARLRSLDDSDAGEALNKLRKMAARGRSELDRLKPGSCSGLALSIGRWLASIKVSLDPDA